MNGLTELPPLSSLKPEGVRRMRKHELVWYLSAHGIAPLPRKGAMKRQMRELMASLGIVDDPPPPPPPPPPNTMAMPMSMGSIQVADFAPQPQSGTVSGAEGGTTASANTAEDAGRCVGCTRKANKACAYHRCRTCCVTGMKREGYHCVHHVRSAERRALQQQQREQYPDDISPIDALRQMSQSHRDREDAAIGGGDEGDYEEERQHRHQMRKQQAQEGNDQNNNDEQQQQQQQQPQAKKRRRRKSAKAKAKTESRGNGTHSELRAPAARWTADSHAITTAWAQGCHPNLVAECPVCHAAMSQLGSAPWVHLRDCTYGQWTAHLTTLRLPAFTAANVPPETNVGAAVPRAEERRLRAVAVASALFSGASCDSSRGDAEAHAASRVEALERLVREIGDVADRCPVFAVTGHKVGESRLFEGRLMMLDRCDSIPALEALHKSFLTDGAIAPLEMAPGSELPEIAGLNSASEAPQQMTVTVL